MGLYVCIILETAHHKATFRIICSITQKTTPEENSHKMFHISSLIVLFSNGKVNVFWGEIWIKFHLGRAKGRGNRGYGGEAQDEGIFCKIPIIKQDTNFISQTFGQTNFQSPPLHLPCPNTYLQECSNDFEQFLLVKNDFVYF